MVNMYVYVCISGDDIALNACHNNQKTPSMNKHTQAQTPTPTSRPLERPLFSDASPQRTPLTEVAPGAPPPPSPAPLDVQALLEDNRRMQAEVDALRTQLTSLRGCVTGGLGFYGVDGVVAAL